MILFFTEKFPPDTVVLSGTLLATYYGTLNSAQSLRSKNPFVLPALCFCWYYLSHMKANGTSLCSAAVVRLHLLRRRAPLSYGTNTRRKPMLLLRSSGSLLLRFAERQFCALLFQLPPRKTRFEPTSDTLFELHLYHSSNCLAFEWSCI